MPEPKVLDYSQFFQISDLFINDLKKVLADLAYVEANKIFSKINQFNNRIMGIAQVNELVRDISYLPYKNVAPLMTAINNNDNFLKYFIPVKLKED